MNHDVFTRDRKGLNLRSRNYFATVRRCDLGRMLAPPHVTFEIGRSYIPVPYRFEKRYIPVQYRFEKRYIPVQYRYQKRYIPVQYRFEKRYIPVQNLKERDAMCRVNLIRPWTLER